MRVKTSTKIARILGHSEHCRLFVKGTSFLLSKPEVLGLAASVEQVLASYARETPAPGGGDTRQLLAEARATERAAHDRSILNTALLVAAATPARPTRTPKRRRRP